MRKTTLPPMPFEILNSNIEQIKYRYDAENDGGNVTWADMRLMEAITILTAHIAAQNRIISELMECLSKQNK